MAIVFIHSGYSPYMEFSLRQARAADPDAEIVLLGDPANDRFPFLTHVDTTAGPYEGVGQPVTEVYEHWSTNGAAFELACFQRWFLLRAWMEAGGHADAIALDTDVMLYATEAEIRHTWLLGKDLGVCWPLDQYTYRWGASPHVSFWTLASVTAFCDFIVRGFTEPALRDRYLDKWHHHLSTRTRGAICDMTALYFFAQSVSAERVAWLVQPVEGPDGLVVCDGNMNDAENAEPDEYAMAAGLKRISWDARGRPVGANRVLRAPVRFHALHFQGKAKEFMPKFYRGGAMTRTGLLRARLTAHYKLRRVASIGVQPLRLVLGRLRAR